MPIFNFKCAKCGKSFETLLKNRSEQPRCPECGGKKLTAAPNRINVGSGSSHACPNESFCPGASSSGCGCGGCCGHKH